MIDRVSMALRVRVARLRTRAVRRHLADRLRRLDADGFSIIANNCVAGMLYDFAGLEKRTPTAGLFFRDNAYPTFLAALADGDLSAWLHVDPGALGVDPRSGAPALMRGGDPAIVFLHYRDPAVAARKWNARLPRLEGRTPVIIVSLRDGLEEAMLAPVRDRYPYFLVLSPAPTPPADEIVLDRRALARIAAFLDGIS